MKRPNVHFLVDFLGFAGFILLTAGEIMTEIVHRELTRSLFCNLATMIA